MRLDSVTAEIRPRSDWEAVDLGFALVRRDFWRCLGLWWLAMGVPLLLGGWLFWNYPSTFLLLFWWLKPAGGRMVLFQLSRRLFGENPSWKSVFRELPRVWWRRFFYRFCWARFSPWLPVTMAIEDLEGLRGKAYKQRCGQVLGRGDGPMMALSFSASTAVGWLAMVILVTAYLLIPGGQEGVVQETLQQVDFSNLWDFPVVILRVTAMAIMIALSLVDVFVAGAGFGIYINNRTWIEGWDVELAFKRLARRLGKVAMLAGMLWMFAGPLPVRAEEPRAPEVVMREVKAAPEFKVNTMKMRVLKPKPPKRPSKPFSWEHLKTFGTMLFVSIAGLVLAFLIWLVWKSRHLWVFRGESAKLKPEKFPARVVMGMEVTPESLPENVPAAAWLLWQKGDAQGALGLLYRGAISGIIASGEVEIQESDTEGDCLRRVEAAGVRAFPDYFRSLTRDWMRQAYARIAPAEVEMRALCEGWPFENPAERRKA
ncbi:MAG: hypothetical protein QM627_11115 [Luteolibacter sp.]